VGAAERAGSRALPWAQAPPAPGPAPQPLPQEEEAKGLPRRLPKGGRGEELPVGQVEPREEALSVRAGVEDHPVEAGDEALPQAPWGPHPLGEEALALQAEVHRPRKGGGVDHAPDPGQVAYWGSSQRRAGSQRRTTRRPLLGRSSPSR
jgi:hypothetical protein